MGRRVEDLDVENGRQTAETLRPDAERIHPAVELDPQFLKLRLLGPRAISSCMSMGSIRALSWPSASPFQPSLRCRYPSMPGVDTSPLPYAAPSSSPTLRQNPTGSASQTSLLASLPPPFAATVTSTPSPATSSVTTHGRRVIALCSCALKRRIGKHRRAATCCQDAGIGPPHTFVAHAAADPWWHPQTGRPCQPSQTL